MDENKNYSAPLLPEEEAADIDWAGMVAKLLQHKKFIIIWTFIASVLGVVVALNTTKKYSASVTLAPEVQTNSRASSLKGLASMFGMGGMTGMDTGDALNIMLFPEMVASTPFLTGLFDIPVQEYVSKEKLEDGVVPKPRTTLYRWIMKKDEPKGIVASMLESIFGPADEEEEDKVDPKLLTKEQNKCVEILTKRISASVDNKTGVTTISVTMDDPRMAAQIADTVCRRLQHEVHVYRTKKASQDLEYYTKLSKEAKEKMVKAQAAYAASVDFDRSVILQTVASERERLQQEASLASQLYQQMEQQREMAKAKYQELKPVFAVVQPATQPLKPINSRRNICMIFFFLGFAGSAAWKLFASDYVAGMLKEIKTKSEEIKAAAPEQKA